MKKINILALLEDKGDPPPLPEVLVTLERRINDPDCDIYEIATLIESDPILAGKLVRLSNSVYFGGGRDVSDTLPSTVLRVGIKMVLELAYTTALPRLFKNCDAIDLNQFWKHSLGVAFLSQAIGKEARLSEEERKVSYLAGLMHDLGVLIFDYLIHEKYCAFLVENKSSSCSLSELEEETFGINHAELGARFLEKWWPVSPIVAKAVASHHFFSLNPDTPASLPLVVCMANQIANKNDIGNGMRAKFKAEPLSGPCLEILKISPQKLETLVEETKERLQGVEKLLED